MCHLIYYWNIIDCDVKQKQKYRGMFETQKSGNKTRSGEIGLNIRTHASPKVTSNDKLTQTQTLYTGGQNILDIIST